MSGTYRHTQIGYVILVASVLPLGLFAALWPATLAPWVLYLVVAASVVLALLFGTLSVRVDGEHLFFHFGIGLIRKRIPLAEIASCQAVRNAWYHGYGIRLIPEGWLYNVSGLDAVRLELRDARPIRLGTDEPDRLMEALSPHLQDPLSAGS